jgi:hypothetical protein
MDAIRRLLLPLKKLEKQAKKDLAAAVGSGRFDDVVDLAQFTKELSEIAKRWNGSERNEAVRTTQPTAASSTPSSQMSDEYPTFVREKDDLVKIGWSTRDAKPYEHRVPKTVVNEVVRAVLICGKSGHRFSIEELMKRIAKSNGRTIVPSYQVYAAISWLKWSGMMLQHGRQGYTVVRPQTFDSSVDTAWQSLSKR